MENETKGGELEENIYPYLQPKVFRKHIDLKSRLVRDEKDKVRERRRLMKEKIIREENEMKKDVTNAESKISYMHFFKPPRPMQKPPESVAEQGGSNPNLH